MNRSGSLLVITLWLVSILAILAVAISRYLSLDIKLTQYRLAHEQARWLARNGVSLAMQRLETDASAPEADGKTYDWLGDDWALFHRSDAQADPTVWTIPFGGGADPGSLTGRLDIQMVDGERRLNVNRATAAQLEQLLGVPEAADTIAGYLDQDSDGPGETVVEGQYYPKNGPAVTLEELRDLPGETPETFAALQRSTYAAPGSGSSLVNINTAGREVLLIVGLTTLADPILEFRRAGHYFTRLSPSVETDSPAVPPPFDPTTSEFLNALPRLDVSSHTFTVTSKARVDRPSVQYRIEAVVRRDPEGLKLLAWKEG